MSRVSMSSENPPDFGPEVDELREEGWTVTDWTEREITLRKRSVGSLKMHFLVAVLTVWWTVGIGNVVYAVYRYVRGTTKTVLRTTGPERSSPTQSAAASQSGSATSRVGEPSASDPGSATASTESPHEESTSLSERVTAVLDGPIGSWLAGGILGVAVHKYYENQTGESPPNTVLAGLVLLQVVVVAVVLLFWVVLDVSLVRVGAGVAGVLLVVAGAQLYLPAIGLAGFGLGYAVGQSTGDPTAALAIAFAGAFVAITVYQFLVVLPGILAGGGAGLAVGQLFQLGETGTLLLAAVGIVLGVALVVALHYLFVVVATAFGGAVLAYAAVRPEWIRRVAEATDPLDVILSGGSGIIILAVTVFGVLAQFGLVSRFPNLSLPESPAAEKQADEQNAGGNSSEP